MDVLIAIFALLAVGYAITLFILGHKKPKLFFYVAFGIVILWPTYIKVNVGFASLGLDRIILFCMLVYLIMHLINVGVGISRNLTLYLFLSFWLFITAILAPFENNRAIGASLNWFLFGPLLAAYIYTFMKQESVNIVKSIFWVLFFVNLIGATEVLLQKSLFSSFLISTDDFTTSQLEGYSRDGFYRIKSVFYHPLVYAQFMLVSLCLSYFYLVTQPFKKLISVYILITYFLIYNTDSRAGLAIAIIIPFIFLYFHLYSMNKRYKKYLKFLAVFMVAAGGATILYLVTINLEDAKDLHELNMAGYVTLSEMSSLTRALQIHLGWEAIKESPIFGYGLSLAAYTIDQRAIDNLYLSYLIETGAVGFSIISALVYRLVNRPLRGQMMFRDPMMLSLLASVAVILIYYLILSIPRANILLFVLLAVMNIRCTELEKNNDKRT